MIFRRITITNLFSYYGPQVLDLSRSAGLDGGNIVLVIGRNGFGKTNLLNTVKLLFLGSSDKDQRQVGFPPRGLTQLQYVLGVEGRWAGIMNRRARKEGASKCSVQAEIVDEGRVIVVERSWIIESDRLVEEIVSFEEGDDRVVKDKAEERLAHILPRELVPFFFFDGEEIQFLADATDAKRAEAMERLLSLRFVTAVVDHLKSIETQLRRKGLPEAVQAEIASKEGDYKSLEAKIDELRRHDDELSREERESTEETAEVKSRMDSLRSSGVFGDPTHIEIEVKEIRDRLDEDMLQLAGELATDAPILANPNLVQVCVDLLKDTVEEKARTSDSVLTTVQDVLPHRLFEEPPQPRQPLTSDQTRFFVNKLERILLGFRVEDSVGPVATASLGLARARELLDQLTGIAGAIPQLRHSRSRDLRRISSEKQRLEKKKQESVEIAVGGEEAREHYLELERQFEVCVRNIGEISERRSKLAEQIERANRTLTSLDQDIKSLESRHAQAVQNDRHLQISRDLRKIFGTFRERRRSGKREAIEEALNRHFSGLMTGHQLIDRITVDDDFFLHFLDRDDNQIGRATISHGMRQLAVTALLWALKEVSGRKLPVIVDTPLARIDRDNQNNLLSNYYPRAAEQVIVLATDSEINRRKHDLLRPHICREFVLENADGVSSKIREVAVGTGLAA